MLDRLARTVGGHPYGDLFGFFAFSHGWTWAFWGVNVVGGLDAFGAGLPFTVLGGVGPMLGGIAMAYVTYGGVGLADLRRRLTDTAWLRSSWALLVVGLFPALVVATGLVIAIATDASQPLDASELVALLGDPVALVGTTVVIVLVGPLPEEIGWRGYLLDRCQRRWSALASGLFVGLVWALWHAPLFVMPGYYANFDYSPTPIWFATSIVLGSVLYTWLFNNVARSVLAMIVLHTSGNFAGQVTEVPPVGEPIGVAVRAGLVVAVVALFGAGSLRRTGSAPEPPQERSVVHDPGG
ncbi:hypothetical protein L593_04410 [Salinarchaeum sp. Harcht-Bsk1]|uniref:CPBP family intramembrane glutamic endopeptidase n=1 Tax=Salinarchaeum sp. Harcht-Bsk1 TaxID=1333523 RepID=UPI0003424822|nr:CPBP family intramembrane glutamic endopeptidase [Salinarchaeum sp. Harcht-Bsk1]AGN00833.1 hypothetical protein L593_04410 [Salinarchaeum sp. Harcht-Bsk1]